MIKPNLKQELEKYPLDKNAKGIFRLFSFDPHTGRISKMLEKQNLILYSGADIMARVLTGNPNYAVKSMYLEYENTAGAPVAPAYDRSGGVSYFTGLAPSLTKDILRVPLLVSPLIDSSDETLYNGNQVTFFGMSEGTAGFFGRAFSSAANSKVYGGALVATPTPDTQSDDVVFARIYTGIDTIEKETGFEIGVTWTIRFN